MTPEQRVSGELAEVAFFDLAIEHQLTMLPTGEHRALVPVHWSDQANAIAAPYASAALNAVRAALTSDDPDVVRAMAVRVGLVDLHPGPPGLRRANRRRHILATPWQEVPDADA